MSNKSILFDVLNTPPPSVSQADPSFPTLSPPSSPQTIEDAILANAKCQIEVVKWLNTFKNIKLCDLFGMVGMLSPAAQAMAAAGLQSDGSALSSGTLEDIIKIIGDESAGGAFTGILESQYRREETAEDLDLLATATSIVPAIAQYAGLLSPLISIGSSLFGAKGKIAETIGYIVFQAVIDLIKQIIVNELYPQNGTSPIVEQSLGRIADALKLPNSEGDYDILRKLGQINEHIDWGLGEIEEEEWRGVSYFLKRIFEVLEIMKDLDTVFENNGQKIFIRTKVVDSTD